MWFLATETYNLQLRNPKFTKNHHPSYKKKTSKFLLPTLATKLAFLPLESTRNVTFLVLKERWHLLGADDNLEWCVLFYVFQMAKTHEDVDVVGWFWMEVSRVFGGFKLIWCFGWMSCFFFRGSLNDPTVGGESNNANLW